VTVRPGATPAFMMEDEMSYAHDKMTEQFKTLLVTAGEKVTREFISECLEDAKEQAIAEGKGKAVAFVPQETLDLTELVKRMYTDFPNDIVGRMKFYHDHFEDLKEPQRSELFMSVDKDYKSLPPEAQKWVSTLAFKCDAGRKQMQANLARQGIK
jgi:hypothetical protein